MANVLVNDASLTAIATAIRGKNGSSATYKPAQMGPAISAIQTLPTVTGTAATPGDVCPGTSFIQPDGTVSEGTMIKAIESGTVLLDFMSWPSDITSYVYDVCYGNGIFVAISSPYYAYSTNGVNWEKTASPKNNNGDRAYNSVCYGNGKFVVVGYDGACAYSTDGINWTAGTLPRDATYNSVCYGNGKFVAISSSYSADSTDGINWTERTLPSGSSWHICYGDGKFVAVPESTSKPTICSTDGINWTTGSISSSGKAVCYGNGIFVAVNSDYSFYSTDGINWSTTTRLPESSTFRGIAYGNGKFVVAGDSKMDYSTDGINWTMVTAPKTITMMDIGYGKEKFIVVGHNGKGMYSPDAYIKN